MSTYDQSMPTTYQPQYDPNYSNAGADSSGIIQIGWLKSPSAWIKFGACLISLITFICATVSEDFVKHWGGGWVQFVSITALILTLIIIAFYTFNIIPKLPAAIPWPFIEMIYCAVFAVLYFIAGIVAAVKGDKEDAIGAAAFFSFAGMAIFGIEAGILFLRYRQQHPNMGPAAATNTTTTASTIGTQEVSPGVHPGGITVDSAEKGPAY